MTLCKQRLDTALALCESYAVGLSVRGCFARTELVVQAEVLDEVQGQLVDARTHVIEADTRFRMSERRNTAMIKDLQEQLQKTSSRLSDADAHITPTKSQGQSSQAASKMQEVAQKAMKSEERIKQLSAQVIQLQEDNERKEKIIAEHVLRGGSTVPIHTAEGKASPGAKIAAMFNRTSKREKEIQSKAMGALEETLLRNMHLEADIKVLGEEIDRLMRENETLKRGGSAQKA
jgi:hypothetical protein